MKQNYIAEEKELDEMIPRELAEIVHAYFLYNEVSGVAERTTPQDARDIYRAQASSAVIPEETAFSDADVLVAFKVKDLENLLIKLAGERGEKDGER